MSQLFILGESYDITKFITVPSYEVNDVALTEEWTDAMKNTHVHRFGSKISGSFTIYFDDHNDFETFVDYLYNNIRADNTYDAKIYCNNTRTVVDTEVTIEIPNLKNDVPYYGIKKVDGYTVNIQELRIRT